MKAISLHQPWAQLVVAGRKRIETRSWKTSHRGPLLIHAARTRIGEEFCRIHRIDPESLRYGFVVGCVELVDCIEMTADWIHDSTSCEERQFGLYRPGRFAWMLQNAVEWTAPLQVRGHQGFFFVKT